MNQKRPIYLNLLQIKFPCSAIASILHRISGVLLFLLLPLLLWLLARSLHSFDTFSTLQQLFANSLLLRFFMWVTLSSLLYHLIAGIRHLLMDAGMGESLVGGRQGAYIVFVLSGISIILLGVWLW